MVRILPVLAFSVTLAVSAQAQSPIQKDVTKVQGPAVVKGDRAEIIPLLWRAEIGEAVTNIPLANIEHYGIQDYLVDNHAKIRELTISLKSRSMVRIYHILPMGGVHAGAAARVQQLPGAGNAAQTMKGLDRALPIKTYPTTTHEKMVEYRVEESEHVDKLFTSLDEAMITYIGRNLDPSQRSLVVEVEKVGVEEEDGLETGGLGE